jgi:hypothetical protein
MEFCSVTFPNLAPAATYSLKLTCEETGGRSKLVVTQTEKTSLFVVVLAKRESEHGATNIIE